MRTNKFKKYLDFRGGTQRDISATRIKENEQYTIKNCRVDRDGIITSRYGASKQDASAIAVGNGNMITQLKPANSATTLLSQFLNNIYAYIDSAWSSVKSGLSNVIMNSLQFGDKMIMGNGINNVMSYGEETTYIGAGESVNYFHTISDRTSLQRRFVADLSMSLQVSPTITNAQRSCNDGTYVYVADYDNDRVVQLNIADLSYVSEISITEPTGVCTDNTNLYVCRSTNAHNLRKYKISDLSLLLSLSISTYQVDDVATDGSNLYVLISTYGVENTGRFVKGYDLTLTALGNSGGATHQTFTSTNKSTTGAGGITVQGSYVYVADNDNSQIDRLNIADFTLDSSVSVDSPFAMDSNASNIYAMVTADGDTYEVHRWALDLSSPTDLGDLDPGLIGGPYLQYRGLGLYTITGALTTSSGVLVRDIGTPNGCSCVDSALSGNLTGAYSYKTTWKIGTLESSASVASNPVTVSGGKKINIANIENPTWLQAIATAYIHLYRTKAGGTTYYHVDGAEFLASTAATTITGEELVDGSLTTIPPAVNTLVPTMKYFAEYQNHVFGAGVTTNPSFLYISALYGDDDWYDADAGVLRFIRIYENDGDEIKGLTEYYGQLYILKRDSLFRLTGVFPSYNVQRIKKGKGTISHRTIQEYHRRLIWLSEDGIELLEGYEPKTITDLKVQAIMDTINKAQEELSFAFIYKDKYYCWIPTGTNVYCDTCIIYDFLTGAFVFDTGISGISGYVAEDADDYAIPYVTDNAGFVWQYENTSMRKDGTVAISSEIKTGKINIQEDYEHAFREVESEDLGSGTLSYSIQVEGHTAETFTKTLAANYTNYRKTPSNQWGKWFQMTITQATADEYFTHRSHTVWYKIKGTDKEG